MKKVNEIEVYNFREESKSTRVSVEELKKMNSLIEQSKVRTKSGAKK